MRSFREVKNAKGLVVEGYAMLVEHGKSLVFSKEKRPELWAEYQESLSNPVAEPKADKIEEVKQPKKGRGRKKKAE